MQKSQEVTARQPLPSRLLKLRNKSFLLLAVLFVITLQSFRLSKAVQTQGEFGEIPLHQATKKLPLRLKVPFYVYENTTLNWYNSKWLRDGYETYKHSDDLHLLRSALHHPLRTKDPTEAQLFFVPTLLNVAASLKGKRHTICVGPNNATCFHKGGFYNYVDRVLGEQEWFQRYQGKDHVIVASHFNIGQYYGRHSGSRADKLPDLFPNLRNCNVVSRQGVRPTPYSDRFSLPSAYIGTPCPWKHKTFDLAMIASLHPEKPDFQARRDICKWLEASNATNAGDQASRKLFSVSVCGEGAQCPALAQSRFGFHVRGDSLGSNRVMDTLLSRTIPLFTNISQYDVLPPLVPWRNLTYLVSVDTAEAFYNSINSILSRPAAEYSRLLNQIDMYMPIFDHTTIYRFDVYMAEFAKLQGYQDKGALA